MKSNQSLDKLIKSRLYTALTTIGTMVGIGTWLFHRMEGWSIAKSFYFTVTTLTTVGYGDVIPTKDSTRVVTAIFILIGVGVVATALGSIGAAYATRREELLNKKRRSK